MNTPLSLFLSLILLFSVALPLSAITVEEAAKQEEGTKVTVTGEVSNARKTTSGALFINFGGEYPNQLFTVFVYKDDAEGFGDPAAFAGKTYSVAGTIRLKNGKAEMQIKTPAELVAADAASAVSPTSTAK